MVSQSQRNVTNSIGLPPADPQCLITNYGRKVDRKSSELPATSRDLASEVGADYTELNDLLAAEKWKEADRETLRIMLSVVGAEERGFFEEKDIEQFPRTDLQTIDRIWVKYSNGRFGFSVQKHIYEQEGQEYNKLGDRVGWRVKGQWLSERSLIFARHAPIGHLPSRKDTALRLTIWGTPPRGILFYRVKTCNL